MNVCCRINYDYNYTENATELMYFFEIELKLWMKSDSNYHHVEARVESAVERS